jgi:hypothetical protein
MFYNPATIIIIITIIVSSLLKIKVFGCTKLFNISLSGKFKIRQLRRRTLEECWIFCWRRCMCELLSVLYVHCQHECYLKANLKISHSTSFTKTDVFVIIVTLSLVKTSQSILYYHHRLNFSAV